jgi:Fe-S cluster assembly ATP-binding protein
MEVPGVTIANFIRAARNARLPEGEKVKAVDFYKELYEHMDDLGMDRKFTARSLNDGFSGGEKKRCEILQMSMLSPKYCILDETDSGLDIDALRVVSEGVNRMRNPDRGILVMSDGKIVRTGGKELALELEERGYDWIKQEAVA